MSYSSQTNHFYPFNRSSEDLLHRLFLCVSGVADQLQSTSAGDLRNILKSVFQMSAAYNTEEDKLDDNDDSNIDDENGMFSLPFYICLHSSIHILGLFNDIIN